MKGRAVPEAPVISNFAQTMTEAFEAYNLTFADMPPVDGLPRVYAVGKGDHTIVEVTANETMTKATKITLSCDLPTAHPDIVKRNAQLATHIALVATGSEAGITDWLSGVLRLAKLTKQATRYTVAMQRASIEVWYTPSEQVLILAASMGA